MSWDAELTTERGVVVVDVNYTHNTNRMIALAIGRAGLGETEQCGGPLGPVIGPAWFDRLDGMSGALGAAFLTAIINEMTANPDTYLPLNPSNGWGDYDSLIGVLRIMRDATPEEPSVWSVSG